MTVRTFIAAEIPPDIQKKLGGIADFLRKRLPSVAWVKAENIHFTLKFLGNVEEERLGFITSILGRVVQNYSPFEVTVGNLGCFPHIHRPSVIWVGIKEQTGMLNRLAGEIEKEMSQLGFKPEGRPFHPHLTLGRVKKPIGRSDLSTLFQEARAELLGVTRIDVIALFKSTLTPKGSIYEVISEHNLAPLGR